jgi:hypothetical protein
MTCTPIVPAQWSTAVTAAQALTDMNAKSTAMTTLAQQALCELNIRVVPAGTSSTTTVEAADYQPVPVMNFDVHLNDKVYVTGTGSQRRSRSLLSNAGFSFHRGGSSSFSMLGPRSLDPGLMLTTRQTAEHERDIAQGLTDSPSATDADEEVRVWTNDFRRYFHQYLSIRENRPGFQNLAIYYEAASPAARSASIRMLVDYFQNPPSGANADEVRSGIRNWMRLRTTIQIPARLNGIPDALLGQRIPSQLVIDLRAALPATP